MILYEVYTPGFPYSSNCKETACEAGDQGSIPGLGSCPGEGNGNPLQCSCHGEFHGQRSLVAYSPWGGKELDTTDPLQRSCLENPRDGGAWWDAVYVVAQSWTRLKRLSSSSSSNPLTFILHLSVQLTFSYICFLTPSPYT